MTATSVSPIGADDEARKGFISHFSTPLQAVEWEESVLRICREYLPPEVLEVLDGARAGVAYYAFLIVEYEEFLAAPVRVEDGEAEETEETSARSSPKP